MPLFVIFVFGSIMLGAGAMLAPALPTHSPRIGLAAALTLAFVTAGSVFYAALFGWNTLVIDYMWFAALVGIFFTGTLSAGMFRAEAEGGTREYEGWAGPRELAFFAMVGAIFVAPILILPVPLDTDAQGFGYLALTMRESGSFTTLAPFHPEVNWLYSPAFPMLVAYLSERLNAGIHTIQFAIGAVLCLIFIWTAYDFGNELDPEMERGSRRYGVAMAFSALIGLGLFLAYMDSHFTALLGLVFALAFMTFVMRYAKEGKRADFIGAALCLGCMPLAQPDMTIVLGLGYAPFVLLVWLDGRRDWRAFLPRWLGLVIGIPLVAVLGISPWLAQIAPLLGSEIRSPFEMSLSHLLVVTVYHGGVIVILALIGIAIGLRRRSILDLTMIAWLFLTIDFSSIGILKALFPTILAPIIKYEYPFSVAWHGPIIPYMYLGGVGLLWLVSQRRDAFEHWLRRASLPLMGLVAVGVLLTVNFPEQLLAFSKSLPIQFFGAFSSHADVEAMRWLKQNTRRDALILNHPGLQEGDWVPIIAERNTVFFRDQHFFSNKARVEAMWEEFRAFWLNPRDPAHRELLERHGVDYVIVPQLFMRPESFAQMFRWRLPLPEYMVYDVTAVAELPYLELVFDRDGAQVYRVRRTP
ncbi:MAG: hypothetical protein CUN49_08380 [Candidatus Thermofonsia Clade 1 bacterium]|uniref:Glycosyltransferase RgtA/B/C/D-like domain-containing protein n=1 Tax=Candidatus Thermofonsia Clade 1 bacterium TaxID=2364210 RepID=A0A2M8PE75_9CHLR|nr:MAG: hypothetical protein CUN49_08380 [Candidatus Thermofonsia Clade 1 bacterium]